MTWMIVYSDGNTKLVYGYSLDLALFEVEHTDDIIAILRI